MLRPLADLPSSLDGLEAVGSVASDDLSRALTPIARRAHDERRRIRLLYVFGPEIDLATVASAWDEARIALRMVGLFDGCAFVSDLDWVREATSLVARDLPCPVRVFGTDERAEAIAWLVSLPSLDASRPGAGAGT